MVRRSANHAFAVLLSVLMAVALLFGHGPVGVAMTCPPGAQCPCDEDSEAREGADTSDACDCAENGDEHRDAGDCPDSGSDSCPDGCPDCRCATGATLAVLTNFELPDSLPLVPTLVKTTVAISAPSGSPSYVFRPPRLRA